MVDSYAEESGHEGDGSFNDSVHARRWVHSPTPDDDESPGSNEYPVKIIGEEIMPDGTSIYEVLWRGWEGRADGTKTTWYTVDKVQKEFGPRLKEQWAKSQQDHRNKIAQESPEVAIQMTTDLCNAATYLRSQAYDEKVDCYLANPPPNWMDELQKVRYKHDARRGQESTATPVSPSEGRQDWLSPAEISLCRLKTPASLSSPSSSTIGPSATANPTLVTASSTSGDMTLPLHPPYLHNSANSSSLLTRSVMHTPTFPSHDIGTGRETMKATSFRSSPSILKRSRLKFEDGESSSNVSSTQCREEDSITVRRWPTNLQLGVKTWLIQLGEKWSKIATECGATSITFTNDVLGDKERLPDIPSDFHYAEAHYEFDHAIVEEVDNLRHFVSSCDSDCESCDDPTNCSCNVNWNERNQGRKSYTIEYLGEIRECNTDCKCSVRCSNRVAQTPRDVIIDIFNTSGNRGWGVRSPSPIERDKVLGLYTGLVMSREKANSLEDTSYVYDLDDEDDVLTRVKYSVDSRCHGNWTRFLNHSCEPNLRVHTFVHDLPIGTGLYYIVFVANKDIPAGTELTLHYNPRVALTRKPKAKKGAGSR